MKSPDKLPFRRRCGWCGKCLRGWQLNLCRRCKAAVGGAISGPPCTQGSHWDEYADGGLGWKK